VLLLQAEIRVKHEQNMDFLSMTDDYGLVAAQSIKYTSSRIVLRKIHSSAPSKGVRRSQGVAVELTVELRADN